MSVGYLGVGRMDRCPNCGSETKNADEDGVRICLACGEHHKRDATGRLIFNAEHETENEG